MADSLVQRSIIGLGMIIVIVGLLSLDHYTGRGWGVILLCVVLNAAASAEFARMAATTAPVFGKALVLIAVAYTALKGLAYELEQPTLHVLLLPLAVAWAYGLGFACLRGTPSLERFRGLAATLFGFLYLGFLGGFALDARFLDVAPREPVGEAAFFYIVSIAKGTDIFAYYFGKTMGNTKVVPSVSPGKTTAGFVGALVGGVVITGLFSQFSNLGGLVPLPLVPGVGIVLALIVIAGDLIESFIKRSVAVKDSASLLPQFGGVLDIVDSVVIVAPAVVFTLLVCRALVPA